MYYPSSQIKTNLYTNGTELVFKTNKEKYIGYYWKTADGKFFTGKNPQEKNIQELITLENNINNQYNNLTSEAFEGFSQVYLNQNNIISEEYNKLNNTLQKVKNIPTSFNPQPKHEDYNLGEIIRYFLKKNNESIYIEVNKETYDKISNKDDEYLWQLYSAFKFSWKLTGKKEDVYRVNRGVTNYMVSKFQFPFFNQFLKEDYLKFWKP